MNELQGMPPPIDPEIKAVLQLLRPEYREASWQHDKIPLLRELWAAYAPAEEQMRGDNDIDIEELEFPGPEAGSPLRAMVIRPHKVAGRVPCIYHIHGGGLIAGDRRAGHDYMLEWVRQLGVVIVSVDYRVAPEHAFPAALDDCYAGLVWTAQNADRLHVLTDRILVAGASAGGGLAAGTALMARDRNGPPISHQLLLCPMLDDRERTVSSKYGGIPWDATSNRTGWTAWLGAARGSDTVSCYAAPARASDLRHLPPAFLDVGGVEVFRDETLEYAMRLAAADVTVELHVWSGATHGFDAYAPQAEVSRAARVARLSYLRRALAI